jgi:hypothetical protein
MEVKERVIIGRAKGRVRRREACDARKYKLSRDLTSVLEEVMLYSR